MPPTEFAQNLPSGVLHHLTGSNTIQRMEEKDVILAVFGGATGLAGLLLIFQGFIITAYGTLPPNTSQEEQGWYRRAVIGTLFVFVACLVTIAASFFWMLTQHGYRVAVGFFWATLAGILVLGIWVSRKLVS